MTAMADRLLAGLASSGARRYGGEVVSELEHALQCAELAREGSADEELQLACLPARIGPSARDHHELGADLLVPWVPERVAWCVHMHADAKRYLCATEPQYFDRLSPASRHTLRLQGGLMSPDDAVRFAEHRWARDAVALRRWDDEAKVVGKRTRSLDEWAPFLRRCGSW
jgi:predicted HD phosphohydrolase